jgi:DNA-binding beta-propeller fold protein YncE
MSMRLRTALLAAALPLSGCATVVPQLAGRPIPPCTAQGQPAKPLPAAQLATVTLPGPALDMTAVRNGAFWFASTAGEVDVIAAAGPRPVIVRRLLMPPSLAGSHQLALTPSGQYLLVSGGSGAVVIDAARAERGGPGPVTVGVLNSPVSLGLPAQAGAGPVLVTPDGRFAFVGRTRSGGIAVYNLQRALAGRSAWYIGAIPVGVGPTGLSISPDGRWLYATSLAPMPAGTRAQTPAGPPSAGGVLSVISVAAAESSPKFSIVRTVRAGCEPAAVVASPSGRSVWVAATGDHALLAFDAVALRSAGSALRASVLLGSAPEAVVPADGGNRMLVVDGTPGGGVTVVDTSRPGWRPSLLGAIKPGTGAGAVMVDPAARAIVIGDSAFGDVQVLRSARVPVG